MSVIAPNLPKAPDIRGAVQAILKLNGKTLQQLADGMGWKRWNLIYWLSNMADDFKASLIRPQIFERLGYDYNQFLEEGVTIKLDFNSECAEERNN